MDNLTHTLVGLTLARTPLGRAGRGTTTALVIASNAPDVDVISLAQGGSNYLRWHRGPTHGPLGVIGLGLATAAIAWWWVRHRDGARAKEGARGEAGARANDGARGFSRAKPASFAMLTIVSMVAIVLHVLMDLPTSYGTRLLSPFDWHWYAFDWLPIIDIYLLIALVAGLFFGRQSDAARRRNAAIVLMLMFTNYGLRAVAHHEAIAVAPRLFGPTLPARCADAPDTSPILDRWPRNPELRTQNLELRTQNAQPATRNPVPATHRCLVEIAAIPTFLSPFDWRVVAQSSTSYDILDVSLTDERLRAAASPDEVMWRQTVRYPNIWTPTAVSAAGSPLGQLFLGFSRFPAVRAFSDASGTATVRFIDMRFVAGLVALEQPVRRPQPFSATIRVASDGRIVGESLGR